jgi:SRSO17 transposase
LHGFDAAWERKSVEPMAARTVPARTAAQHQSLLHFVGVATWSDEKALTKVREMLLPAMTKDGPIEAWIIDDTSFPKQGKHSVGVHHQDCGQLASDEDKARIVWCGETAWIVATTIVWLATSIARISGWVF